MVTGQEEGDQREDTQVQGGRYHNVVVVNRLPPQLDVKNYHGVTSASGTTTFIYL